MNKRSIHPEVKMKINEPNYQYGLIACYPCIYDCDIGTHTPNLYFTTNTLDTHDRIVNKPGLACFGHRERIFTNVISPTASLLVQKPFKPPAFITNLINLASQ